MTYSVNETKSRIYYSLICYTNMSRPKYIKYGLSMFANDIYVHYDFWMGSDFDSVCCGREETDFFLIFAI